MTLYMQKIWDVYKKSVDPYPPPRLERGVYNTLKTFENCAYTPWKIGRIYVNKPPMLQIFFSPPYDPYKKFCAPDFMNCQKCEFP